MLFLKFIHVGLNSCFNNICFMPNGILKMYTLIWRITLSKLNSNYIKMLIYITYASYKRIPVIYKILI